MTALSILPNNNEPAAHFETITPQIAAIWLQSNTRNRNLRRSDVNRYARDMAAGRWRLDGSPIRFDDTGTLLDGQHRLTAVVESGQTITSLVVRGLDDDSQDVMDTGIRRTAADALTINDYKNGTILAAIALIHFRAEADALDSKYEATHEEIKELIVEFPELIDAAEFASKYARRTDCPPAIVGYTYWRLGQIDRDAAEKFWIDAAKKVGLAEGDPIIALTNRFAEGRRNRERITRRIHLSLIYRAWNARRAGKTMRFIRVNSPAGGLVPIPDPR